MLGDIGRKITSSLSVETIISTVYDSVNSLMDAAVFGIGIYHEDTKQSIFLRHMKMVLRCPLIPIPSMKKTGLRVCVSLVAKKSLWETWKREHKAIFNICPLLNKGNMRHHSSICH
jgi:hypothetical protein